MAEDGAEDCFWDRIPMSCEECHPFLTIGFGGWVWWCWPSDLRDCRKNCGGALELVTKPNGRSITPFGPPARRINHILRSLCPAPHPAFRSSKALETHKRVVHGCRSNMRYYAPGSGICSSCGTNFNSRLRLLAHLVDSRRPKCRDRILQSHSPKLSEAEVSRLDELDRKLRRDARRAGHTHVLASGPATRADGTVVGRVGS